MKIIHISDTHLVAGDAGILGLDPQARLAAVVADVVRRQADADLAVVTGDLTDLGEPEAYARLRETLAPLPMPVRLLVGNHDRRDAFLAAFPDTLRDENGFVQSVLDAGPVGRLIFLDTLEHGWSGGRLCPARLAWLAARLDEAPDRPVIVFLHHAPFDVGLAHFTEIGLHDARPLLDILRAHRGGVRHVFCGHVHIPVSGIGPGGLPFTAARGCNHQMILDFEARDCAWAAGGPNYGIIDVGADHLFVHAFDFVDAPEIGRGAFPPGP